MQTMVNLLSLSSSPAGALKFTIQRWIFLLLFLTGCVSPLQNFEGFEDNSAHAEALIRALNEVASGQRQFGGWTSSEDEADGDLEQDGGSKAYL